MGMMVNMDLVLQISLFSLLTNGVHRINQATTIVTTKTAKSAKRMLVLLLNSVLIEDRSILTNELRLFYRNIYYMVNSS
jgi:hypothetical protein